MQNKSIIVHSRQKAATAFMRTLAVLLEYNMKLFCYKSWCFQNQILVFWIVLFLVRKSWIFVRSWVVLVRWKNDLGCCWSETWVSCLVGVFLQLFLRDRFEFSSDLGDSNLTVYKFNLEVLGFRLRFLLVSLNCFLMSI